MTACSTANPANPPDPTTSDNTSQTTDAATTEPPTTAPTATKIALDRITSGQTATLDTKDLPEAPEGFTDAEVAAFADRAIDVTARGVSPRLAGKTGQEAFDYVFANQYPASSRDAEKSTKAAAGAFDWQWSWASLFKNQPAEPAKFHAVRWQVDTTEGTRADGTNAPQLRLSLSTTIEHLIPDGTDPSRSQPMIMQRTVTVVGFEPLGGPQWWPAFGIQANPLLGGKCAPINGSVLTPTTEATTIAKDLKTLQRYLDKPETIKADATSDPASLAEYVEKYCED